MAAKRRKRRGRVSNSVALLAGGAVGIAILAMGGYLYTRGSHKPETPAAVAAAKEPAPTQVAPASAPMSVATIPVVAPTPKADKQAAVAAIKPTPPVKRTPVKMSASQWDTLDALMLRQFKRCWSDASLNAQTQYVPKMKIAFSPNGALMQQPVVINVSSDPAAKALADSALKAVVQCKSLSVPASFQPYYDEWKTRVVYFDPSSP